MMTFFARHTYDLDIDRAFRDRLWAERMVAIHFPEDSTGHVGASDNESLNPDDYPQNAALNLRALNELAAEGGYVLAQYHDHTELLLGRVDPGTQVQLLRGRWGSRSADAVLKAVPLKDSRIVSTAEVGDVWAARPPRATLRRWHAAGDAIAKLMDADFTSSSVNQEQRAYLAWNELADFARNKRPVWYETLGSLIDIHHRAVKHVLAVIQDYCLQNRLPPLTILVVNKNTGLPGDGFIAWDADNLDEGKEQVFGFDWHRHGNPYSYARNGARREDLVEQLVTDPASAADIYALTRVRGSVQMLFRDAALKAYNSACAFCGSRIPAGLDAAHLVPWGKATQAERLDVRNGVLLTSWHHRLFDAGLLTITEDYLIRVSPNFQVAGTFDQNSLSHLDGQSIRLPADPSLRPERALIRRRNELLRIQP
jgi:putative restriction endonuclease